MDKSELIDGMVKAYWMELETVMNYLANAANLDGVRAAEIKESLSGDVTEEIGHAQTLANRVREVGGVVPGSKEFSAGQDALQPPAESTEVVSVIKGVIAAETEAIAHYKKIIKMAEELDDYVSMDVLTGLLASEESHLREFTGFLKEYEQ
jgi:bacterioferritin